MRTQEQSVVQQERGGGTSCRPGELDRVLSAVMSPAPRSLPRNGLSQDNSDSQQSPITLLDRFAGDVQRDIQANKNGQNIKA
ncbi:hypothetical protein Q8A67_022729 [Cirrhinus molitorella]|uniref:Uncharacterized protein n=1 Tax=Cirrhinus molitorella TaxID=172907 RepID=A0AA88P9G9_9TELE|nr:hypothetical protein Q8A67_022729 [Cirrhinus molitorella]